MKGMCILVYGLMSLISTWVLILRRSSATEHHIIRYTLQTHSLSTWTEVTFTTHPLCALWWKGRPLCYCDLFSGFSQIQWCHCSGRRWKGKQSLLFYCIYGVPVTHTQTLILKAVKHIAKMLHFYVNTILIAVLSVHSELLVYVISLKFNRRTQDCACCLCKHAD